jgi:hypothetical protein
MGLRGRLRKMQKATERNMVTIELRDGTTARFYDDEMMECFVHEMERGRRHYFGEDPGDAHPVIEALRNAREGELERLVPTEGTFLAMLVGEDEIIRGERERPGPPVTWNEEGTVCN